MRAKLNREFLQSCGTLNRFVSGNSSAVCPNECGAQLAEISWRRHEISRYLESNVSPKHRGSSRLRKIAREVARARIFVSLILAGDASAIIFFMPRVRDAPRDLRMRGFRYSAKSL